MPNSDSRIKLTTTFMNVDIDSLLIQEAPKYLLRCMKEIPKDSDGAFIYENLIQFLRCNTTNEELYQGSGIKSLDNTAKYWNYAMSTKHPSGIPNFTDYFTLLD